MWNLQQRMWLSICYSSSLALLGLSSKLHSNLKKKKSECFTISARLLTLLSICFEISTTVCSHELFLAHLEGHVSVANTEVWGDCFTTLLHLSLVSAELRSVELGISKAGLEDKLLDLLLIMW